MLALQPSHYLCTCLVIYYVTNINNNSGHESWMGLPYSRSVRIKISGATLRPSKRTADHSFSVL